MAWQDDVKTLAQEGYRSFKVAKDVAGEYGALTATVTSIQYGGVTFLVTSVLAPAGMVVALVLVPLWPWIFVLPALLMALAMAAAAFTAYMLLVQLPKRARVLLTGARKVGAHALERYDELRTLAEDKGWVKPSAAGNGGGAKTPLVARRTDLS